MEIGLAAIVSDKIYGFGELLVNPIVNVLKDHKNGFVWMAILLEVYNKGDIKGFKKLCAEYGDSIWKIPLLRDNRVYLEKKIQMMAVVEMVFSRDLEDRTISFADVSQAVECHPENVELVLLKAMALGLIKGSIDQVKKTVYIWWVCPRVLDKEQIKGLMNKVKNWAGVVASTQESMEKVADVRASVSKVKGKNEIEMLTNSVLLLQKSLENLNN